MKILRGKSKEKKVNPFGGQASEPGAKECTYVQ